MTDFQRSTAALVGRIKLLSEMLWEGRCTNPEIDDFLANFDGSVLGEADEERLHALHLLANVSFFGLRELRILLRSLYRDLFRYPIVQRIRSDLGGTRDVDAVHAAFDLELGATRFMGMGNPAESGTHLLYYFRQENQLPKDLFVQEHALVSGPTTDPTTLLVPPGLKRVVFLDDLCGSGSQAVEYSQTLLQDLRAIADRESRDIEFQYLVLFGTVGGMKHARDNTDFDVVQAVNEIDETYKTYSNGSRLFQSPPDGVTKANSRTLAESYGSMLWAPHPLGFDDSQLLLAMHHNVPDNSLPVIWYDERSDWRPAFPRYAKVY
jgi:hypothetical protein